MLLTVALERDIREDDAQNLINAIMSMRGVLKVEGNIADVDTFVAESRVRQTLGKALWEVLYPIPRTKT